MLVFASQLPGALIEDEIGVDTRCVLWVREGEMLLVGKNQVGTLTKTPTLGESYESIIITLNEDMLRKIALEEHLESRTKYAGLSNIPIPSNPFLEGYFQSIIPYIRNTSERMTEVMEILKVKELIKLLLHHPPQLQSFLFDFSEPYKVDLERFMLHNFKYNVPLEKFA
ncbi:hypothetical protein [Dyadobacter sandarakinus]|uniref:hypothetical protein n=1 Tax=Dyadobacter sandarakinus TaxID=2747268 RepID=UPI001E55FFAC|nr:hypothetical protein [Dyadobacter sandarakinus]